MVGIHSGSPATHLVCGTDHRSERPVLNADITIERIARRTAHLPDNHRGDLNVEGTELRRSTLERKDRDELVTIATALGAKPPSRARKSEIVDLIIASATTGGADDEPTEASADANGDAPEDDEDASTYHAGDDEFDFGEVTTKNKGGKGDSGSGRGRGKSKSDKAAKADKGDNAQKSEGNSNDDAPTERGNRRRRRRGRGGDNDGDAGPVNV